MEWNRFTVIDVETTGFSPANDRIVEVAAVLVEGDRVVQRWASLVNPGVAIPDHASAIHGITDDMVGKAPLLAWILPRVRELCSGRVVTAHCAGFDLSFVGPSVTDVGLCTMRLARVLIPEAPNHKNQTLRSFLGIDDISGEKLGVHRALDDAIVTAHVLIECRMRFRRRFPYESWEQFARTKALVRVNNRRAA